MPTALARGRDPALRRPAARPERGGFIQINRHACEGIAETDSLTVRRRMDRTGCSSVQAGIRVPAMRGSPPHTPAVVSISDTVVLKLSRSPALRAYGLRMLLVLARPVMRNAIPCFTFEEVLHAQRKPT